MSGEVVPPDFEQLAHESYYSRDEWRRGWDALKHGTPGVRLSAAVIPAAWSTVLELVRIGAGTPSGCALNLVQAFDHNPTPSDREEQR